MARLFSNGLRMQRGRVTELSGPAHLIPNCSVNRNLYKKSGLSWKCRVKIGSVGAPPSTSHLAATTLESGICCRPKGTQQGIGRTSSPTIGLAAARSSGRTLKGKRKL